MASPLSRGLFARAIGESGALIAPIAPVTLATLEKQGQAFAKSLGQSSLASLRQLPAQALLDASKENGSADASVAIDGYLLTEAPAATFARGEQAHVPLLLGSNSQEGFYTGILDQQPPTPANYRTAHEKAFRRIGPAQALALYPGDNEAQVKQSAQRLVRRHVHRAQHLALDGPASPYR